MGWIRAMRIPTSLMAGILVLVGFKLSIWSNLAYYLSALTFLAAAATMVLNDWFDRYHDLKKGKVFAYEHGSSYLFFAISLWILVALLTIGLFFNSIFLGLTVVLLMTLGICYSMSRKVPLLPAFYVAITSGLVALYPNVFYETNFEKTWLIFSVTVLVLFGREVLKDIEDHPGDIGYKRTLPQLVGVKTAKLVVCFVFLLATAGIIAISSKVLFVAPIIILSIILLFAKKSPKPAKEMVSISMTVMMVILLF